MIVNMKKVSIVMLDSDRNANVSQLEKLGLLHVETARDPGNEYAELKDQRAALVRAYSMLPAESADSESRPPKSKAKLSLETALEYAKRIQMRSNELKAAADRKKKLTVFIENIEIWGDFKPQDLEDLKSRGIKITLGSVDVKKTKRFLSKNNAVELGRSGKSLCLALLDEEVHPDNAELFREYSVPGHSLSHYKKELRNIERELAKNQQELFSLISHRNFLADSIDYLDRKLEFTAVYHSMAEHDSLAVISGFAPAGKMAAISEYAEKSGWAILISDPGPDDAVPTLVRNKRAVGIIAPVFSLMGTVPGYRENDISFMFLLFFSLFFAMIIGDGAYGMIILLGALTGIVSKLIKRQRVPDILFLMALMGITTVVWGSLTGTWFGSKKIAAIPWFRRFVIKSIYSFDPGSEPNVKLFCFIIGTVHIAIAHLWNIIKGIREKIGLKVIAQFGWLSMVLGLFYVVLNLVLNAEKFPIKVYVKPMILGGLGLIILFGSQEGHFLKGIARGFAGLITTVLDSIASFSDIISYIRLFAVGLATVEIAKSFNAMAEAAGSGGSVWSIIGSSLILLFGHALNLGMGALSVIVHGVRLNMLEFSGHLGMEWTGIEYKPFGRNEIS